MQALLLLLFGRAVVSDSFANPWTVACPWDFPGKNSGVGCHFLLQEIFPTQGLKLRPLHWQADSLPGSRQGSSQHLLQAIEFSHPHWDVELVPSCCKVGVQIPAAHRLGLEPGSPGVLALGSFPS